MDFSVSAQAGSVTNMVSEVPGLGVSRTIGVSELQISEGSAGSLMLVGLVNGSQEGFAQGVSQDPLPLVGTFSEVSAGLGEALVTKKDHSPSEDLGAIAEDLCSDPLTQQVLPACFLV